MSIKVISISAKKKKSNLANFANLNHFEESQQQNQMKTHYLAAAGSNISFHLRYLYILSIFNIRVSIFFLK